MTLRHITLGTCGARLHGDVRPTVDREHNRPGDPFVEPDSGRLNENIARLSGSSVRFTDEQRLFLEDVMPALCTELGWALLACAAAPDRLHTLVRIPEQFHGKQARALLKRRLTQSLDEHRACPKRSDGSSWWGEGGSTKAVRDDGYRANVIRYIEEQKTTRGA